MIEEIFSKREQVRFFDLINYPNQEVIENILEKTVNLVPSKQNMVPYKIHVLGPDQMLLKKILFTLASRQEIPDDWYKRIQNFKTGNTALLAPYVLLFEKRLPEPNDFIQRLIDKGHKYPECCPNSHWGTGPARLASLEVGLFSSILTGLCVEQGISLSYTECLPNVYREYPADGSAPFKVNPYEGIIDFIDENIILAVSLGYQNLNISERKRLSKYTNDGETKPDINTVIKWL